MKKLLLVLGSGLLFSLTSYAGGLKIGVVDFQQVLKSSPKVAAASKKLEGQFQTDQKKIVAKQKELKSLMNKYKKDSSIMRDSDKQAMQKQLAEKQNAFVKMSQGYQQKVMAAQQKAMQKIVGQINEVVTKMAKKKGLDIVFPRNAVAFVKSDYDMTKAVQKASK